MALNVTLERRSGGLVVATLAGRLDTATAQHCQDTLQPVLGSTTRRLLLDLARLEYISSMGLRVVALARKALEAHGGQLVMANLQAPVAKVFEIAALLPKESIFSSVAEADAYLDAMQRKVREGRG